MLLFVWKPLISPTVDSYGEYDVTLYICRLMSKYQNIFTNKSKIWNIDEKKIQKMEVS